MRPVRLQVQGFTAFRGPTEVDFDGADLFALTGPTGSGKSSLVDAMVFALYGTVPRLDRRAVAPIISLGALEAKLRLDFTVGGEAYTAVRVVRRTAKGATTKEARLERADGEVLAGTAEELTEAVTALLGLGYEHFVKCVVLPQGAFAAFLHDSGADRQGLLVKLLDLGLYDRMAGAARQREAAAGALVQRLEGELDGISEATPEAVAAGRARVAELEGLAARADTWAEQLVALEGERVAAAVELDLAHGRERALASVHLPAGVADRAGALAGARQAAEIADGARGAADALVDQTEAELAGLPVRAEIDAAVAAHAELAAHRAQQEKGASALAEAEHALATAADAVVAAEAVAAEGAAALESANWEHRAHDLAARLAVGEVCPVCAQVVLALPAAAGGRSAAAAREVKQRADAEVERCRSAVAEAQRAHDRIVDKLASIASQVEVLEARVEAWPDPTAAEAAAAEVARAEAAVRSAAAEARRCAQEAVRARAAAVELSDTLADDHRAFDQARDALAALGPPPVDRGDLVAAWDQLVSWAADQLPSARAEVAAAEDHVKAAESARSAISGQIAEALEGAGLTLPHRGDPAVAIADAVGSARNAVRTMQKQVERAAAVHQELAAQRRDGDLARSLGQHLSARGFEQWVLDEVLVELCARATDLLRALSSDAYSLASDGNGGFVIVDHRNADEQRSARTLSGGETFLASLALALALADQVGQLAAEGAARIESLFLDEGFGSLDPETLDTVAAAIEELGSQGRMVGLISHVSELAERVPVRFVVAAEPGGSTVTKVFA